jgi:hypothetical protein
MGNDRDLTPSAKIMYKIMKYTLLPFFYVMIFAAIMGKDGMEKYHLGEQRLLTEEYLVIVFLVIFYDIIKYFLSNKNSN